MKKTLSFYDEFIVINTNQLLNTSQNARKISLSFHGEQTNLIR